MMQKITIVDPKKKKRILAGYYSKSKNSFTKIVKNEHFMIKEQGYGIQVGVITLLEVYGCEDIFIRTKTLTLKSKLSQWLKQPTKNYGHGKQIFLTVKEMKVIK